MNWTESHESDNWEVVLSIPHDEADAQDADLDADCLRSFEWNGMARDQRDACQKARLSLKRTCAVLQAITGVAPPRNVGAWSARAHLTRVVTNHDGFNMDSSLTRRHEKAGLKRVLHADWDPQRLRRGVGAALACAAADLGLPDYGCEVRSYFDTVQTDAKGANLRQSVDFETYVAPGGPRLAAPPLLLAAQQAAAILLLCRDVCRGDGGSLRHATIDVPGSATLRAVQKSRLAEAREANAAEAAAFLRSLGLGGDPALAGAP